MTSAPAFQPAPLDGRMQELLADYPTELFGDRLYRSIELMERYSIDLAIDLLRRLDVFSQLGECRTPEALCQRLDFQPCFAPALRWLLQRLLETGCVQSENGSFRLSAMPWSPDLAKLREIGCDIDAANAATLDLLDYAASLYPAVARGQRSGEEGLFEPRGVALWLNYFHNSNPTYAINNWIASKSAADRLESFSQFRILELGAGAGSATGILLSSLEQRGLLPHLTRYVSTEPNAFFRRRAQRDLSLRYSTLPLEWSALDIDSSWQSQGIQPGSFDLIYGVNVLHVARDLLFSLEQARESLALEGWLVIGECVRPFPRQPIYAELVFQILDSFTEVNTDPDFRPNAGFLTPENWRRAFTRARFRRVEMTPNLRAIAAVYPHFFTGVIAGQP